MSVAWSGGGVARAVGSVAVAFALLVGVGCKAETEREADDRVRIDGERFKVALHDDDRSIGGEHPLVTIVLFSDYACPPCAKTWTVMERLVEDYGDDVRIIVRSFTQPGFSQGEAAADAVYAAEAQGKFWEMHRRLFAHPGTFDRPSLRAHAEAVGLDVERFLDDLDTGAHTGTRIRHRRQAKLLGIDSLPIAFVNGLALLGYREEKLWHGALREEVARAREMIRQGTPRADIYEAIMDKAKVRQVARPAAEDLRKKLADQNVASLYPRDLTPPEKSRRYAVPTEGAAAHGPADAPVEIVQFIDFRCPYCKRAWTEEIQGLVEEHGEQLRVVTRHLPLDIHPTAQGAAIASIAADRQGKFWEFHGRLLVHEGALGRSDFTTWAKELGLDEARFVADLDDPALAKQVADDVRLAAKLGITGTPGLFINGRYQRGFKPGRVRLAVEGELAAAKEKLAAGTPPADVRAALMDGALPPKFFPN